MSYLPSKLPYASHKASTALVQSSRQFSHNCSQLLSAIVDNFCLQLLFTTKQTKLKQSYWAKLCFLSKILFLQVICSKFWFNFVLEPNFVEFTMKFIDIVVIMIALIAIIVILFFLKISHTIVIKKFTRCTTGVRGCYFLTFE